MQKWEYYYLSHTEWRQRVTEKVGYRFKFLMGRDQRKKHRKKCEQAIQEILNELGDEGWELVSSIPVIAIMLGLGGSRGCEMIFRREKS